MAGVWTTDVRWPISDLTFAETCQRLFLSFIGMRERINDISVCVGCAPGTCKMLFHFHPPVLVKRQPFI